MSLMVSLKTKFISFRKHKKTLDALFVTNPRPIVWEDIVECLRACEIKVEKRISNGALITWDASILDLTDSRIPRVVHDSFIVPIRDFLKHIGITPELVWDHLAMVRRRKKERSRKSPVARNHGE